MSVSISPFFTVISLTVLSATALATVRPSGEKATFAICISDTVALQFAHTPQSSKQQKRSTQTVTQANIESILLLYMTSYRLLRKTAGRHKWDL
jgi:hypothetical protein